MAKLGDAREQLRGFHCCPASEAGFLPWWHGGASPFSGAGSGGVQVPSGTLSSRMQPPAPKQV